MTLSPSRSDLPYTVFYVIIRHKPKFSCRRMALRGKFSIARKGNKKTAWQQRAGRKQKILKEIGLNLCRRIYHLNMNSSTA